MSEKIKGIHSRTFVYDKATQKEMSSYNQMLVEMAFTSPDNLAYSPAAFCIISAGPSCVDLSYATWDVDTLDEDALTQLIGRLEYVKAEAIKQIQKISDGEDHEE